MLLDPAEQSRQIGRNAGRYWERGDVVSRDSIDNGQTGVDVGAVLGIDGAVNCRREYDTALFLQPLEGTGPCGIVGRDVCACDGNQPSAFGKSSQGGSDVTQCRLSHLSIDMDRSRERRVHQHDIRAVGRKAGRGKGRRVRFDIEDDHLGHNRVGTGIIPGKLGHCRVDLDQDEVDPPHPPCHREPCRADAGAEIDDAVT